MVRNPKAAPTAVKPTAKKGKKGLDAINVPAGFEDVTSNFDKLPPFDFEAQDTLEGEVTKISETTITDERGKRDTQVAHVVTDDGEEFALWHSAGLDDLFSVMQKGSRIRVVYTGTKQLDRKRTMKLFRAFHRAP